MNTSDTPIDPATVEKAARAYRNTWAGVLAVAWSDLPEGVRRSCRIGMNAALSATLPDVIRQAKAEALRDFADTRGVNVGDEDDEWWRGYRQAQRECLHAAATRAQDIEEGTG